jgi:hypothetical protein
VALSQIVNLKPTRGLSAMNQLKSRYRNGSTPDQIDRMQLVIAQQWAEVWTVVETRHQLGGESLMTELKLVPDQLVSDEFLSLEAVA